ncbi:MAG: hypothetical protein UU67_C0074G0007 [Candidatus Daviesbacteria bacterium GW2011_GWB1_41_5]|uniref:Uncharacterized protein n=1 Tax=Candidatus Daviesbacteria bacterium GW2011_GWB1_41_5 TaxID=1618429 RepID=A0A0G0WEL4_9BACT|nr:MAG: hypothetical protein UU67_C0074G0007 [Candidatus Daviesbacteria bacterium GW2011_GWB1_41_5]
MRYPALSDMWRLDMALRPKTNGKAITEGGQSRILYSARQIIPLTLFPDQITVEELRIVWLRKMGPWMNEVVSIMATDIASVNCSSGLFFGFIHVQSLTGGPEILVDNLLKKDVLVIRSLVEGIAMSAREGLKVNGENLEAEKQSLIQAGTVN